MNVKLRVILITMLVSLLVWAACAALVTLLSSQSVPATNFTYKQAILIVLTLIIALCAALVVGIIMSRITTQHRKALEEMKESEERIRALSEAAFEGIFIHDGNIFLETNDVGAIMLRLEPSEIRGKPFKDYITPQSYELVMNNISESYTKPYEVVLRRKDGTAFPVELCGRDVTYKGKRVKVLSMRDITERKKTEAELRFKGELLDACSDSLLWHDYDGTPLYVNEAACRAHGYTHDEMMKVNLHEMIVPEFAQLVPSKIEEIGKTGDAIFESAHYRKDGSILPLEIHAHTFKWGDKIMAFSICRDITERKQAEELLKTISLNSPASIFVIQDDKFRFVNPRMIETIGYTEAELMEMDTDNIIHPEDKQKVGEEVTKALKGEQAKSCEYRGVRKDGNIIWMIGSIKLIQYHGRRAILGTVVDITAQKVAEEALKGTETKYHELVNIITSGVAVYQTVDNGEDFVFVDFNGAAEKIERISREEVLGKRVTEVFPGVKDFGLFKVFQKVWQTGNSEFYPSTIYKDARDPGTWRENWVYKLPGGEIVAVYNNITERKRAEDALKASEERFRQLAMELKHQNDQMAEFLRHVTHELKTPLTAIISSSEILTTDGANAISLEQKDLLLNNINRSAYMMDATVSDLVDLAKIQIGRVEVRLEPLDLRVIIDDLTSQISPLFKNRQQSVEMEISGNLPLVKGDRKRTTQVILNLLSNANKFSTLRGHITIIAREQNNMVRIEVKDTAPIINETDRANIFEPYYRGGSTEEQKRVPGLGLGLAISKSLVTLMGGEIGVLSGEEHGNTFFFTLPIWRDEDKNP